MRKTILIVLIVALAAGCYYDSEEGLYPQLDLTCDTTGVTYSKTIVPILQTNCYGCHSSSQSASYGGNINLESFTPLKTVVGNGRFYGSIIHNPSYSPMPKSGTKLDTCSVTKIKIWIDKGALNN
jgi:hypothetical protein